MDVELDTHWDEPGDDDLDPTPDVPTPAPRTVFAVVIARGWDRQLWRLYATRASALAEQARLMGIGAEFTKLFGTFRADIEEHEVRP